MKVSSFWNALLLCCLSWTITAEGISPVIFAENGFNFSGSHCPGIVNILCEGRELSFLRWRFNEEVDIQTYTPDSNINESTQLSDNPAFISVELVDVSVSQVNARFFNFTSILSVNISQLQEQNITKIECGDSVDSAIERVNVAIIQQSPPDDPVITNVSSTFSGSGLDEVTVNWLKVPIRCPVYGSMLYYQAALIGEDVNVSVQVPHEECGESYCSAVLDIPQTGLSANLSIGLSAVNPVGSSQNLSIFRIPIAGQNLSLSLSYANCVTSAQCLTLNGTSCSIQYTTDSSYSRVLNDIQPIVSGETFLLPMLRPDTTYYFSTSISVSTMFGLTERKNFTTGSFDPQLTTSSLAQIVVGASLTLLSVLGLVLICGLFCNHKNFWSPRWKVSLSLCLTVCWLLLLVCLALWIAVGCIVGLQDNTCNSDWQHSRDSVIACALAFCCLTFLALCLFLVLTCCGRARNLKSNSYSPNGNIEERDSKPSPEDSVKQVTFFQWLSNWLYGEPTTQVDTSTPAGAQTSSLKERFWAWWSPNTQNPTDNVVKKSVKTKDVGDTVVVTTTTTKVKKQNSKDGEYASLQKTSPPKTPANSNSSYSSLNPRFVEQPGKKTNTYDQTRPKDRSKPVHNPDLPGYSKLGTKSEPVKQGAVGYKPSRKSQRKNEDVPLQTLTGKGRTTDSSKEEFRSVNQTGNKCIIQ